MLCWHPLQAQISCLRLSSVVAQTLKSSHESPRQFGVHCCFSSCSVLNQSGFLCQSKCECVDLSGLPVQCHTSQSPAPPHPCPYRLFLHSCPPPKKCLNGKETIRPQSSADTETLRHPHLHFFFLSFSPVCRICCVL